MPEGYHLASIKIDPPRIPAALRAGKLVQSVDRDSMFCCGFMELGLPVGSIPLNYVPFAGPNPDYASEGMLYFLVPSSSVEER